MRRVVVTGLGMVSPLGCGVEPTWKRILERPERRAQDRDLRRVRSAEQDRLRRSARRRLRRQLQSPTSGWSRRTSARSTISSSSRWPRPDRRSTTPDWHPATEEEQLRDRHHDRLRHRRPLRHRRHGDPAEGARAAQGVAVLHSRPPDQSRLRLCLDRARPQGAEPCGGDGLLDRRACDRRRQPADRARRCRRDGRRRHGIADLPHRHGRLLRGARALDRLQRDAGKGLASLRQGSRRLRDGRGRRRRRARGI